MAATGGISAQDGGLEKGDTGQLYVSIRRYFARRAPISAALPSRSEEADISRVGLTPQRRPRLQPSPTLPASWSLLLAFSANDVPAMSKLAWVAEGECGSVERSVGSLSSLLRRSISFGGRFNPVLALAVSPPPSPPPRAAQCVGEAGPRERRRRTAGIVATPAAAHGLMRRAAPTFRALPVAASEGGAGLAGPFRLTGEEALSGIVASTTALPRRTGTTVRPDEHRARPMNLRLSSKMLLLSYDAEVDMEMERSDRTIEAGPAAAWTVVPSPSPSPPLLSGPSPPLSKLTTLLLPPMPSAHPPSSLIVHPPTDESTSVWP